MKKYIITVIILTLTIFLMAGCSNKSNDAETAILEKISAEKAKEMMDTVDDLIILDVRTQEEYEEGYIKGAILIPDNELESKAGELLTDKNATILVYCRSGRRSALSAQVLSDLGYTSIYDFGGIIDWPYEIVTD